MTGIETFGTLEDQDLNGVGELRSFATISCKLTSLELARLNDTRFEEFVRFVEDCKNPEVLARRFDGARLDTLRTLWNDKTDVAC